MGLFRKNIRVATGARASSFFAALFCAWICGATDFVDVSDAVPLYRVFEVHIRNTATRVANPFSDVLLETNFTSPSGKLTPFWGFFNGNFTFVQRFMPSEIGEWHYAYRFSDNSMRGSGMFKCVADGSSPGVLQPYKKNPHWFAYNGIKPVLIKSYYNKAGGTERQDPTWVDRHLYAKMADRGYNHHMASGFLPVLPLTALWDGAPLSDGPQAINHTIYTDPTSPHTSMSLDVWASLEGHLAILNDYDISVQFFQGFNAQGPNAGALRWSSMSRETQRWWVGYVVARVASFANIAGYQYSWESRGNDTSTDYELATMLRALDPFQHGTTYEEENVTIKNHFDLPEWTFASVEALGDGDPRLCGGKFRQNLTCVGGSIENHHNISLQGYRGKPVYMCEGHDLWRSWWHAKEPNVVRAAWAVTTAAASFTWSDMGHLPDDPYASTQAFTTYPSAAQSMDVLARIMTEHLPAFYRMRPADGLLVAPVPKLTFCLAEVGSQYLVYSDSGAPFAVRVSGAEAGTSFNVTWFDPVSGQGHLGGSVHAGVTQLTPPMQGQHWVLTMIVLPQDLGI